MLMKKKFVAAATAALMLTLPLAGCSDNTQKPVTTTAQAPQGTVPHYVGAPEMPDFTVKTADGKEIKLSDLKGKTVVVTFGATWCPDCRQEFPVLDQMYKKLGSDKDVVIMPIVLLSSSTSEKHQLTQEDAEKYIKDEGLSVPFYYGDNQTFRKLYQIKWIPTMYVFNPEGKATQLGINEKGEPEYNYIGEMNMELLEKFIKAAQTK